MARLDAVIAEIGEDDATDHVKACAAVAHADPAQWRWWSVSGLFSVQGREVWRERIAHHRREARA